MAVRFRASDNLLNQRLGFDLLGILHDGREADSSAGEGDGPQRLGDEEDPDRRDDADHEREPRRHEAQYRPAGLQVRQWHDEREQEHHEENDEDDLGEADGRPGNGGKAKEAGDECDDEECDGPG